MSWLSALSATGRPKRWARRARLRLAHRAEREACEGELLGRGGEQEVALVALGIDRPEHLPAAADAAGLDVVAGGECCGAELARGPHQVGELDGLVAGDAGHRGLAGEVAVGEALDDGGAKAGFEVEDVVGNAEVLGDAAGIVDVAAGAAGAGAMSRLAVVVELQRHADNVVAGLGQQRRDDGRVDAAGHGDDDAGVGRRGVRGEAVEVHRPVAFWGAAHRRAGSRIGETGRQMGSAHRIDKSGRRPAS